MVVHVVAYGGLFLLIAGESAGVPLPGETALIAAAILASQGKLSLAEVIAVAATAAILGDNTGYLLGRRGGRWLLTHPGPFHHHRLAALERSEPFFARHGSKTVFLGRWLPFLRVTAAWLAGASRLEWKRFLFWNALGGILWAITVGAAAYLLGEAAARDIRLAGFVALGAAVLALAGFLLYRRTRRRLPMRRPPGPPG